MKNWHFPSAIGRPPLLDLQSRSSAYLRHRHFHTSPPCHVEEKAQDAASQGSTHGRPSRAKRNADASVDIQNLYQDSIVTSELTPKSLDERSLAVDSSGQTLDRAFGRAIDARSLAADTPRQNLDRGIPRVVDARSLAASPPPDASRFTIRRTIQRQLLESQQERPSAQNDVQRTRRPESQEGRREGSSRGPITRVFTKGRDPSENDNKSITASRTIDRRSPRNTRDPRIEKSQGPRKDQKGGTRREGGRDGNKRRNNTSGGRRGDRASAEELRAHEEEMEAYNTERRDLLDPKPVSFEPTATPHGNNFKDVGPAVLSSIAGMKEILSEKMQQPKWVSQEGGHRPSGEWPNAKQKRDVLSAIAQVEAGQEGQNQLLTTLFSGGYLAQHPALLPRGPGERDGRGKQKDDTLTMQVVGQQTARNESYDLFDERGLLDKVKSLVAATPPRPPTRRDGGVKQ